MRLLSVICPFCRTAMKDCGDGRYLCTTGCGEWLSNMPATEAEEPAGLAAQAHVPQPWPELSQGVPETSRAAMVDIATIPLGIYSPGEAQGHIGKGGGGKNGRGKSPARQKMESWQRKQGPGRHIRSFRPR
jgi:hypothetical protein